ncbi:MAG: hypothetical protein CL946_04845, partial [Ectothiorhodospiraceae bacterium]|nr:hypothetical protein [Ectothiorhodospiraceae bacterium]
TDVKNSPLGDITLFEEDHGDIEIVYAAVKAQKSGPVVTAAPASVSLEQNYPNPFNPSTSISYTLTDESTVTLRVLDMLGREVSTLVNETQAAGSYSVVWEGTDASGQLLPSGTYLYRLDAVPANGDAFTSTKKMTLSK